MKDDINFAALLTPQGKIIADFFVTKDGDDHEAVVSRKTTPCAQRL